MTYTYDNGYDVILDKDIATNPHLTSMEKAHEQNARNAYNASREI